MIKGIRLGIIRSRTIKSLFFIFFFLGSVSLLCAQSVVTDTIAARKYLEEEKVLTANGDYSSAVDAIQKAKALYFKNELWDESIKCQIRLAELGDLSDEPELKIKNANLSLIMARQYLPNDHPVLAFAFRQKAEALTMLEQLDSANYFLIQAIPLFEKHQQWDDLGWSEIILGVNYLNQYKLDSCEIHFQEVEHLLVKKVLSKTDESDIQATLLSLLGALYEMQGDFDKAIQNTKTALALDLAKPELSAIDSSYVSYYYNNLGALYLNKGDYQRALDNFMQASYTFKDALNDPTLLNNIGELLNMQLKFREAIPYFEKSLALIKKGITNDLASNMNALAGLALSYRELDQDDEAMSYAQRALNLPTDYRKSTVLSIMGNIKLKKNQAAKAIEYFKKASEIYGKDSTTSKFYSFFNAKIFQRTGVAYFLNDDPETALKYFQKALIANHVAFDDSINLKSNPPLTGIYEPIYFLDAIHSKAKTQASFKNQPDQLLAALVTYKVTMNWIDSLQVSYVSESAQLDWSGEFKSIYEESLDVADRLYKNTKDQKYLDLAFSISEKSKNAILLETLKSNEGKSLADIPDSLLQEEKDLNLDIAFYEKALRKLRTQKEEEKVKLYQQYLSSSRLKLVDLKEEIERSFPQFHKWKYGGKQISIAEVQSRLINSHTAFLEYFIGNNKAYVFVITKSAAEIIELSSPNEIKVIINEFNRVLLAPETFVRNAKNAFREYQLKAFSAHQILLNKANTLLSSDIQKLIIVPDGILNAVPFEALCKENFVEARLDFSLLPYVLYDFNIHYAYSADLLLENQARREKLTDNIHCLALAPPYQGNQSIVQRGSLEQLRSASGQLEGTAKEIQQISHFVSGQFDVSQSATEQQFKLEANQFGILHLAMHGVVDMENPSFNHLKFSDFVQDSTEDNLLHQYEIANMDLTAQLVVLSACETGVGKYEEGEGVYSLARSFMYSGVPSVVMSLWKVSDVSTAELMPYFYENLLDGQSKDIAMQQAKIRFLKEANIEFRHPFYWSAFVVMGDAQQLKKSNKSYWYWG